MLAMTTITVHGLSPLGSLVNKTGTRAVIAGVDPRSYRGAFLLYNLSDRKLLQRIPMPARIGGATFTTTGSWMGRLMNAAGWRTFSLQMCTFVGQSS